MVYIYVCDKVSLYKHTFKNSNIITFIFGCNYQLSLHPSVPEASFEILKYIVSEYLTWVWYGKQIGLLVDDPRLKIFILNRIRKSIGKKNLLEIIFSWITKKISEV